MDNRVLIVDDNEDIFRSLRINFTEYDYRTEWTEDGAGALRVLAAKNFDVVLLDLSLKNENGIDVLTAIQRAYPGLPVIIITGYGTFEAAVKAIKLGAFDFLSKPLDFDKLLAIVENAISLSASAPPGGAGDEGGFLTRSPQVLALCQRAKRLAATNIPILITGESGTGKELLAEYIHKNSPRRNRAFVRVNCSSLTDTLVNAELFGHEKGAFTGAVDKHIGLFEQADGGSLHLDEIGDMGMANQAKILRILEDSKLRRIGGAKDIPVDVRIIASTNKNIEELIAMGAFRQDLLFRLNAVLLYLPPLREREGDLELLARRFFSEFAEGHTPKRFSAEAWNMLLRHNWPGNVRELRNLIKVCAVVADGDVVGVENLPESMSRRGSRSGRLNDIERETIIRTLAETQGNKSLAAARLGITRRTLYKKLERYGMS